MTKYQESVENLNKIESVKTEEEIAFLYTNVTEAVKYLVTLKYRKLDFCDAEDIASNIGTYLIDRYRRDPEFKVRRWPMYLGLLILDEFKKSYKENTKVESLETPSEEESTVTEVESVEMDTDSLVDLKHSVEHVYILFQRIVSTIPAKDEQVRNILERIIVFAALIDESILSMLQEPHKRIARAHYGQLRHLITKSKGRGLLISRKM